VIKLAEPKRSFTERRRGPDAVIKAVWWTVGISWLLFIAALVFIDTAKPETETFFDRMFDVSIRDYWNENMLLYAFFVMVLDLAVCIIGLIFNLARHKRKTDRISKSILILGILSLSGILWYLLR
jgi:hypothetical protein